MGQKHDFSHFLTFSRAPPGEMKKSPRHEALDFPEVFKKMAIFGGPLDFCHFFHFLMDFDDF